MKKMLKKLVLVVCIVAGSLFFSCAEIILPKRMQVQGTANLPARLGVSDLSEQFIDVLQEAFVGGGQAGTGNTTEVFNVEYKGQSVLTFCIYNPIEMTENLNPTVFLQTISRQINNGISSEPRAIAPIIMPAIPGGIPVAQIQLPVINPVYLDGIAAYVVDIDFERCDGTVVDGKVAKGIGLNFYLEDVVPGLEMIVECEELHFSGQPQRLKQGDNIFGNTIDFTLILDEDYKTKTKGLVFTLRVQSTGPDPQVLPLPAGVTPMAPITIMAGKVEFFQNWTEATIDMEAAVKANKSDDKFVGAFPKTTDGSGFDMSKLGEYLDGDFTFVGLETNIYMNNPVSFPMRMTLEPKYDGREITGALFDDDFSIDADPFALDAYLEDGNYTEKHLPGIDDKYVNDSINDDVIVDIFHNMPSDLTFEYRISFSEPYLTVYPSMFENSGEQSTINMAFMIMMPLSLVATNNDCVVVIPELFGNSNDLFGRDEEERLSDSFEIKNIKMTVDFLNPIFSGGRLFVDGYRDTEPLLFNPNGIRLSKKSMVMNITESQVDVINKNLIKPNFWIQLAKGDTVTVPKKMGIVRVNFEMNVRLDIKDLLE